VFGGPSPEHDVSILTGLQSERLLAGRGFEVLPLYWTRGGEWYLCPAAQEARDFLNGAPPGAQVLTLTLQPAPGFSRKRGLGTRPVEFDIALNCCHGAAGEGGPLHGVFEQLGVPLSGGPVAAAALGMDKLAFGAVLRAAGIPVLERVLVGSRHPGFDGPYIVKPRYGGSSIGIEVVDSWETAQALSSSSVHLRQGAVAEPYMDGAIDLNMSYRTVPDVEVSLLERPLRPAEGIYTFADKYMQAEGLLAAPRELPADVPTSVTEGAAQLARDVHQATGIRGLVRLDFLLHDDRLVVNEINTIPGAMGLYLWPDRDPAGLLADLLDDTRRSVTTSGAAYEPGAALRAAGGISSKLGRMNGA
jgi:D-alanine-D-alanine ligase